MKKTQELELLNNSQDFSLIFPTEVILFIFSYLTVKDLGRISLVNKLWNSLAKDDKLWTALAVRDGNRFGIIPPQNKKLSQDGKQYYRQVTSTVDLHILSLTGHHLSHTFFYHGKVEKFKDELCKKYKLYREPESNFPKLIFAGKVLDNKKSLFESNVAQESGMCQGN